MHVLVTYASKYGSTAQIAERIGHGLTAAGHRVTVERVDADPDPSPYDAFVIGSCVYYGLWRPEARAFADRHRLLLRRHPVWLFSSGPVGDAGGAEEPHKIEELTAALAPRDHRVFAGRLTLQSLRFGDRMIASLPAFAGNEGDFRNWQQIDDWAAEIAAALTPAAAGRG